MMNEFNTLENKIALVVSLCRTLRAENMQLKLQLAAAEDDRRIRAERMESACSRLEQLAKQLPESKATV